jgi:hypothetical protein
MDPGLLDQYGRPRRQDFRAASVDGLYYIGLRWLTMRASGIFLGFPTDAAAIAESVAAQLADHSHQLAS